MKKEKYMETTKIDYSTMTEEEFFNFLDAEAARLRRDNMIIPLSPTYSKMAKVSTESNNQFEKTCNTK